MNIESAEEKEDEKKDEQDVVFVQDVGFTIKITAPGVEPFDIQVKMSAQFLCFVNLTQILPH